jgi:hypothetical protein
MIGGEIAGDQIAGGEMRLRDVNSSRGPRGIKKCSEVARVT